MRARVASDRYTEVRKCKAIKKNGDPCKLWAVWGDTRCNRHGGSANGRIGAVCDCEAYPFPHRPGGGLCEWPDPPTYKSKMKPSTHSCSSGRSGPRFFSRCSPPRRGRRAQVSPI
jgi:hypothetical protein